MKKILYYGFWVFIVSAIASFYYVSVWKNNRDNIAIEYLLNNETSINEVTIETGQVEEKISYDAKFALKKYYDECGHFTFQYSELPQELVNLSRKEIEETYSEWAIEEFSSESLVLSQEINNICNEHYFIKLGDNNVEIYQVGNGGSLNLYRETDISKEYLTTEDIGVLENGMLIYGNEKLNSIIEDFE